MEDRKKVWPELSPNLSDRWDKQYAKYAQQSCAKKATFESRTNTMKNNQNIERHNLDEIDARNI